MIVSICYVTYHGKVWEYLVECGWITESVFAGRARMRKESEVHA